MGKRGPAAKPTRLRVLEGNPSKRPLPKNEPKPRPITPVCPKWLDAEARAEWKTIVPELEQMGLLTIVDGKALAAYCQSYSEWRKADEAIQAAGSLTIATAKGDLRARPEIKIRNDARQAMRIFLTEFGMSPSSRTRIAVKPPVEDDLDKLLGGKA